MDGKKWYDSKTLWINTVAIIAILVQTQTGFVIDGEAQAAIISVINLILRPFTTTAITK